MEGLNEGTVPMFKMHNKGTVPTFKMHNVGYVLTYKMHNIGTARSFYKSKCLSVVRSVCPPKKAKIKFFDYFDYLIN